MGRRDSLSDQEDASRGSKITSHDYSRDRSSRKYGDRKRVSSRSPLHRSREAHSRSPPYRRHRSPDHRSSHHNRSRSRSPPRKRPRHDEPRPSHHPRRRSRSRSRSRSPPWHRHKHHRRDRRSYSRSPPPPPAARRSQKPLPSQSDAFTSQASAETTVIRKSPPPAEKQRANYAPSGLLAAETNTVANTGIVLKYNEPGEARLPPASQQWRLYVFKGEEVLETLNLFERSCWLFGREGRVADHMVEHPSCSKQHAVLQFRYMEKRDEWGATKGRTRLYVLDLESANGTSLNGERIPERRYVEVKSGDVVRFGESSREYVALLPPQGEGKGKEGG